MLRPVRLKHPQVFRRLAKTPSLAGGVLQPTVADELYLLEGQAAVLPSGRRVIRRWPVVPVVQVPDEAFLLDGQAVVLSGGRRVIRRFTFVSAVQMADGWMELDAGSAQFVGGSSGGGPVPPGPGGLRDVIYQQHQSGRSAMVGRSVVRRR